MAEKDKAKTEDRRAGTNSGGLSPYLHPISVWALAFGCAVGWGAFVMPGTSFLPAAGPAGTAIAMLLGTAIMLAIAANYHYMMIRCPDSGGAFSYAKAVFGYDHAFLCVWFIALVYVAIIWANATALVLVGRNLIGSFFQFGFHYQIAGYDVYLGEVLLTQIALIAAGCLCLYGKRLAGQMQTLFAVVLMGGIVICFAAALWKNGGDWSVFSPPFQTGRRGPLLQICGIVALAPWAFVGFESISHSTGEFLFSPKKSFRVMAIAVVSAGVAYTLLAELAVLLRPAEYKDWSAYIAALGQESGFRALPTFFVTHEALGKAGLLLLGVTLIGGIATGLIGNYIAASRLFYSMALEDVLPAWFGKLNRDKVPKNAIPFLMLFSLLIPFAGRAAIGWIVDVNTIGACIAYGYTSAAAYRLARKDGNHGIQMTGVFGLLCAVAFSLFLLLPNLVSGTALATESYLILAVWSVLGFVFFHSVFRRDTRRRFGQSTVVWITLLFSIFFLSIMWLHQTTHSAVETALQDVSDFYVEEMDDLGVQRNAGSVEEEKAYRNDQLELVHHAFMGSTLTQMMLIFLALAIMYSLYTILISRERRAETERMQAEADKNAAEESSRAKTTFLSNMSHDIRTPMNAIIGYTNLAMRDGLDAGQVRDYLDKIDSSSKHLLALINDVLEMSRIESGKMDLEPVEMDLRKMLGEVRDMFATQMKTKQIDFIVDASHVTVSRVLCDKNRLNRVLLNLLSNAYKFTPEGGTISVTLWQIEDNPDFVHAKPAGEEQSAGFGKYELRVKDSGIGMTKEFAARVFEAFERERTSTVSGIQGTGLGMAITKSIVDLMGGTIEVDTAPGEGTEFIVRLRLPLLAAEKTDGGAADSASMDADGAEAETDFSHVKLLLVEDNEINREIATLILEEAGFQLDEAVNGAEAVQKIAASQPGDYDLVLMDIQMPVMNGYEATQEIRALANPDLAHIPIIAMTANAFSEDIQVAEKAGMDGHIAKPIDIPQMMRTLRSVLRR